jgi:hypothetical protein
MPAEKLANVMNDFERILDDGRNGMPMNFDKFVHRTKKQLPQVERYMKNNWHAYTKLVKKAVNREKVSRGDTVDFRSDPDLLADSLRAAYKDLKFQVEKEQKNPKVEEHRLEKRTTRDLAVFHDDELVAQGFQQMGTPTGFGQIAVDVGIVLFVAILVQGYRGRFGIFGRPYAYFATSFVLLLTCAASGIAFYLVEGTAHFVSAIVAYLSVLALFIQLLDSFNLQSSYMVSSFRRFTAAAHSMDSDKTARRLLPPVIEQDKPPERNIPTYGRFCSICLEEELPALFILPCGHRYHRSCILEWADLQRVCPVCKQDFDRIFRLEQEDEENDKDNIDIKSE